MNPEPVNPYTVPHSHDNPIRPLRPFEHKEHRDLYVSVNHSGTEYERFQGDMGGLDGVMNVGGLVLVTGETGCGKTALLNRCAAWVVDQLAMREITCEVVDITRITTLSEEQGMDKRLIQTTERLYERVKFGKALTKAGLMEFKECRREPLAVYENISSWLAPDHALAVLLPSPREVKDEVINYAQFATERVMFLAESGFLTEKDSRSIVDEVSQWIRPVTLHVGPLKPGDVRTFIERRENRHGGRGRFPRMSEDAMTKLGEQLQSVKQLQGILEPLYERRRKLGIRYDDSDRITVEDIENHYPEQGSSGSETA